MSLDKIFNKYITEDSFIKLSYEKLKDYGFNRDNTIAGVCLCRDEICQSILFHIRNLWGEVFNFSSFAGLYTSGKIGAEVFISHAPEIERNKKCVFYVFSHIGLGEKEEIGICKRKGLERSTACGALILFLNELSKKDKKTNEVDNHELTFVRQRLLRELSIESPSLLDVTQLALRVTCEDIEKTMENYVQSKGISYALISGIQVHYIDNNYIVPKEAFVLLDNKKIKFEII
ncbi:MAG: hypothetical protein N3A00_04400 [Thermodesulfovibrio sp.]|nr:hypothetical protein [Thermodesulfovibrio sp.]